MLHVRLAGGHLSGKQLFTWLSLVVSFMASFCAVPFPTTGCLKKTWTFFENAINPLFMEETFPNFLWL